MNALQNGMIWLSRPGYTVGLIVRGGRVVDCPPLAHRWAYGKLARDVWNTAAVVGARLMWRDDEPEIIHNGQ